MVKPKKGTTMETIGKVEALHGSTESQKLALIWTPLGAANVTKANLKEGSVKIGLRVEAWCLGFGAFGA